MVGSQMGQMLDSLKCSSTPIRVCTFASLRISSKYGKSP
jgi:hypothetical protein